MFVKILFSNVLVRADDDCISKSELDCEHCYDCNHYALFPSKEPRDDTDDDGRTPEHPNGRPSGLKPSHQKMMNLMLEFNKTGPEGWDRTITFPLKGTNQIVEVFIMNNDGKTIDRYIY